MRTPREHGSVLAEAAITVPVMLLLTLGLVNMALYGFAAVNAANAARYGARAGSVAQTNAVGVARNAALAVLNAVPVGSYTVQVYPVAGGRGSLMRVAVYYEVPNFFQGLAALFGGSPLSLSGAAEAFFRMEGW